MLERHIQTALLSLITAAILFGAQQIFALSVAMAKVQVTLEQLAQNSKQYVTMEYVTQRARQRDLQFDDHERRIQRLEAAAEKAKK